MVHPYLYEKDNVPESHQSNVDEFLESKVLPKVKLLLARIHVAVVGPGLGRDELMLKTLEIVIKYLREKNIPIVIDADGLYLVSQKPDLINGYEAAILTPNVVEFKRLADAVGVDTSDDNQEREAVQVSQKLGNVTIVRKGTVDIIVKGELILRSDTEGSNKRAGGQGDTLTGTIATLMAWSQSYKSRAWEHSNDISDEILPLLAGFGGSVVTRIAARQAFKEKGRAMMATDLNSKVGEAYQIVIEDKNFQG
jgi:ATP-dependent NAD(P)H-hydrate dehydratase